MVDASTYARPVDAATDTIIRSVTPPTLNPLAYSIHAASKLVGISKSKTWALIRDGKIRSIKLGRRTLITSKEIERLLQNGC